jgi:hypothetical protein
VPQDRKIKISGSSRKVINLLLSNMNLGTCKLCEKSALLHQSHIIPSSLHKITKDNNGKNVRIMVGKSVNEKNQRDLKEEMLCTACEKLLSTFEKRTIELLRPAWKSSRMARRSYPIPAISIAHVLMFTYSVFWRASIAKSFSDYKLPTMIEERLKRFLLGEEFLGPSDLPISLGFLKSLREIVAGWEVIQYPASFDVAPGYLCSNFLCMGIVFSMISPAEYEPLGLAPFVTLGERYLIVPASPIVAQQTVAIMEAVNEMASEKHKYG